MSAFFRRRANSSPAERSGPIRIEPARPEDVPAMVRIERRSFPTPWSYGALEDEVLGVRPHSHVLVARWGTQLVGYVIFWAVAQEAHIVNIAVDPEFRRRGIGRSLLAAALRQARRLGLRRATLEVRPSNRPAIHLYESYGFRMVAIRPGYYSDTREDAYIMWLDPIPPELETRPRSSDQESKREIR